MASRWFIFWDQEFHEKLRGRPSLYDIELDGISIADREDTFRLNLEVADRYLSFSAELLRLALLGFAGIGFLITHVELNHAARVPSMMVKTFLLLSLLALGLCALAALVNRYVFTDSAYYHLQYVRACAYQGARKQELEALRKSKRDFHYYFAYMVLWVAVGMLCMGAIFLGISLGVWLWMGQ